MLKIMVKEGQEHFKISGLYPGQVVEVVAGNSAGDAPAVQHVVAPADAAPAPASISEA